MDSQVLIWDHVNAVIRQKCQHPEVRNLLSDVSLDGNSTLISAMAF